MTPRLTSCDLLPYGRPAMTFSTSAAVMPGSVFSCLLDALLMSIGLTSVAALALLAAA